MGPRRTPDERRVSLQRGAEAEAWVAELLEHQGWAVVARNWTGAGGELDLVVQRGGALRVVEVKLRAQGDPVGMDAIGATKRRKLIRATEAFLDRYSRDWEEACIGLAWVEADRNGHWSMEWIDDAFDG